MQQDGKIVRIIFIIVIVYLVLYILVNNINIDLEELRRAVIAIIFLFILERIIDNSILGEKEDYRKLGDKEIVAAKNKDNTSINKKATMIEKIKESDSAFDERTFLNLTENIFLKYQKFLTEGNIENVKSFLTETFYEKQREYMESVKFKNANKRSLKYIEFGGITTSEIIEYTKIEEYEAITVKFKSYDIKNEYNLKTGEKIKGLSGKKIKKNIFVVYKRKRLNIETAKEDIIISSDCPNCGAPTQIASVGKCHYCGAIIEIGTNDWKIDSVRRYKDCNEK